METVVRGRDLIAYFFGEAFLTNTIPHLVSGVSGSPMQTPFASPYGVGLSSSTVNVLWGMFNLVVAYLLLVRVGRFDLRRTTHVVALGLGVFILAMMLARQLGRLHGGILDGAKTTSAAEAGAAKGSRLLFPENIERAMMGDKQR